MSLEGFICQKCGEEYGHNFLVKQTYNREFTKPYEEDEKKMLQVALADDRYKKYIVTENKHTSIDYDRMAEEDKALAEELDLHSRYELELRGVETSYLSDETGFVEEYGTCPNCHTKGQLRRTA